MPFGNGARPLTSSIQLPTPGLIVAQEAPLHHYYALANELTETARQWEEAKASVTPKMASDLADMTIQYPDLPASVLTGAVAGGINPSHPALQSLNDQMGYVRTLNPIATAGENILSVPFDFIRAGVRLTTTVFASIYEEAISRPTRTLVGMSQGMGFDEAYGEAGSSYGLRALQTFANDPWGNLTPDESSPEGQVNLGSGWLPQSNKAESDSAEVQMLMRMGIPEANAIAQVQQGYGDPITHIAYEQAQTGITFDSGLSISPGRLAAKGLGVEEGTTGFHIVSGVADLGSQLFLDPTNLALWGLSKARLANKMLVGNGTRRGLWGIHVDDYLASPAYREATETISNLHLNEDVANALDINHISKNVEDFSVRRLVADATNANTPEKVDAVLRPYFGSTDGSAPMFAQALTPRSIYNPSGSRRTLGQVLGGQYAGAAGDVGQTFGLKAAVRHNLEGTWAGRMFSEMPGGVIIIDELDEGYSQLRPYANSMGMTPEESHPFLQAFAELRNGDGTGAQIIVDRMNKWFVENKIEGASDDLKRGFLKMWNRWRDQSKYWLGEGEHAQWMPDTGIIGIVDDGQVVMSKDSATLVTELYNNSIPLIAPREVRRALSDEGILKIAKITSKEVPVSGLGPSAAAQSELTERIFFNVLDSYMQKIWKPFVLLRVAWPVRVVFEEQFRMAASGLDSMFHHPISWLSYVLGRKMNQTLLGESLEVVGKKAESSRVFYDFTPGRSIDEFTDVMAGKAGPFLDASGKSIGEIKYVNVWQTDSGFADAWLWNLAKNHKDPIQTFMRANGIDDTVEWMMNGSGNRYLKQLLETAGPERATFLADGQNAARLRWYLEGLHARSVKLTGGDYVYWNPHVRSAVIDDYKGGWLSSSDRPLTPDEIATHKLDPHGPPDMGPEIGRPRPDGSSGPSPVDGLPESGAPRPLGPGPAGTEPLTFGPVDIGILVDRRQRLLTEMQGLAEPDEIQKLADQARRLQGQIDEMRAGQTAANPPVEIPIQPRVSQFDRPFSKYDQVRPVAQSGKAKDKAFNTMGYHMNTGGYDPDRAFASLFNELVSGRKVESERLLGMESLDLDTANVAIDDIARFFMGADGTVDDAALTARFNEWAEHADLDGDLAEALSYWMVDSLNVRHQQQLDLLNYVYPGRLSVRQAATEALLDSKAWGGTKIIVDDLTPDQMAELRFAYRFLETLTGNETDWGRNISMTIAHVFDNYSDEFVRLNYDSPIVKRMMRVYEDQQNLRPKPVSLHNVEPKGFDEIADIAGMERTALGEVTQRSPEGPSIITGYGMADGGADNLVLYEKQASGRAMAAVTVDDYVTIDINVALERAISEVGEAELRKTVEAFAVHAENNVDLNHKIASFVGERLGLDPGPNGAYIFQGQVSPDSPMLKGVSQELKNLFDDLRGAWFKDMVDPDDVLSAGGRRVNFGGYDGVWSPSDQAAMVRVLKESGILTKQGQESLAKVIAVIQRRDAGMTRGWFDKLGQEIAGANRMPARPMKLISFHELETKTSKDLADELVRLAANFHAKEVAAGDIIRALKPGATVDASSGMEARLVEIVEEMSRRGQAALVRGDRYADELMDTLTDSVQRYAQLVETDADELLDVVRWVDDIVADLDLNFAPSRSYWPKHTIDEFNPTTQPHLYYGDTIRTRTPEGTRAVKAAWDDLPDESEVWIFHATDPHTARRWEVDGINPIDKPIDKTRRLDQYEPGAGRDPGTYGAAEPQRLEFYGHAAAQKAGAGHDGIIVGIKVRKGDLKAATEGFGHSDISNTFDALTNAGIGVTFGVSVPPGNIRMFGTNTMSAGKWRQATMADVVKSNIDAGAGLSDDAADAIRLAERAGYRVEVVGNQDAVAEIWIMDRDRMIRILDRDIDDLPLPGIGDQIEIPTALLTPEILANGNPRIAAKIQDLLDASAKSPAMRAAAASGRYEGIPKPTIRLELLPGGYMYPESAKDYHALAVALTDPKSSKAYVTLGDGSEGGWADAADDLFDEVSKLIADEQLKLGTPIHIDEFIPGGGRNVVDNPEILTVSDAVVSVLGDEAGTSIAMANGPRRGFQYMLEQPYGQPRLKQPYGPHYADGTQIDIDNLSIMGTAKTKLKATLPDAPKGPVDPTPPVKPIDLTPGGQPAAIGAGKQPLALGTGEDIPSGGFPSSGGMNDPNFQGTHYKIIKDSSETGRKMVDEGVIKDPATGEDMALFGDGTIDSYAADMEGLPARHAALSENLDSAPPNLAGPNPTFDKNQVGVWDRTIDQLFYYLMSVPTNRLSRAPAFKQYYLERVLHLRTFADDATKVRLDKALKNDLGVGDLEKWRRDPTAVSRLFARGEAGQGISMTFEQIDQIAKGYALERTRTLLYDMSKKHDASDVLRNIFPFAEAWGEIITAWSKIMWENPRMFRRAQQGLEAAREQGWFYKNENGDEVFAYPGSGFMTNALMGTGEQTDVKLTGTTAGVNLALGQYIPGFGPAVQVPASMLLPKMPTFDVVRDFLMPYGDEEIQTPGDILNLGLPAWWEKVLVAIGTGSANYKRLHNNTVMDVFKILAAENPEKMNNAATARALMEEASNKASLISWWRAGAAFFSPTSPQIEYRVEDVDGTMWQMQSMTAEYYRLLRKHNFDQQLALEDFVRRFGWGEGLLEGLGVASLFVTAKSIEVQERGTTKSAYAWQRNNHDLFEPDAFPYTAAYAMQDLEWDDFDYNAYLDTLKTGTREATTPEEWLMRRNTLVGNIAYDHAKSLVEGRTDRAAKLYLRDMRIKLAREYNGFDGNIAGLPQRPDTESQIREIERWVTESRLNESNAGQAAQVYMALRRRAEAEAYNRGLMPDSWASAGSMVEWRNWLRRSAEALIGVFPEFGQLWFDVFRWELTEDETPEVLALGGMTF